MTKNEVLAVVISNEEKKYLSRIRLLARLTEEEAKDAGIPRSIDILNEIRRMLDDLDNRITDIIGDEE